MGRRRLLYGAEEVVIWVGGGCYMGRRRLLYADKPKCRKAAPSKIITSHKDIKQLLAAEYKNRLRTRHLKDALKLVLDRSKDIFSCDEQLKK